MEGVGVGDVVHHHGHGGVADVGGDERPEALLPSSVPQLQAHRAVLQVHGLGQEVDADGGLKEWDWKEEDQDFELTDDDSCWRVLHRHGITNCQKSFIVATGMDDTRS